jgi:hypothetical protein
MKSTHHLALVLAASLLASCACSPDLRVSGVVLDAETGKPLPAARIHEGRYAQELAAGAFSDAEGEFSYYTYPEEHNLIVEKEGYETYETTIALDPRARSENVAVRLRPLSR